MPILQQVLVDLGLEQPDARPLHALRLHPEHHTALQESLRLRVATGQVIDSTAAMFVLWAAEHIRAHFKGGQLRWEFVFQGLGLAGNQSLARELVERGLRWWKRSVRVSEQGRHMYLYTLMAEGGLPEALLNQPSLYQRVLKGLLREIEAEGAHIPEVLALRIAERWVGALPQTFQSDDIARLLADLALALVRLRSEAPADLPLELLDRWLDKNRPRWVQDLPLRMSKGVADALIRPALQMERSTFVTSGPLARRVLIYDETLGQWRPFIKVAEGGALSKVLLPEAAGLRMRLLPTGASAERTGSVVYSATPDEGGWTLRRIGGSGGVSFPFQLDEPFILSAFTDGRLVGEVEIVPAMPAPDEYPSLWRAVESSDGMRARELVPITGSGKTRAQYIWVLTAEGQRPEAEEGLSLSGPTPAGAGFLWRVTGSGNVRAHDRSWRICTGAEEEEAETQLVIHGPPLRGWRLKASGGYAVLGAPDFFGQRGTGALVPLRKPHLRTHPGRLLMSRIVEWVEREEILARGRYVALPDGARLALREVGPGSLELKVESLPPGLSGRLSAGTATDRADFPDGSGEIILSISGAPPGEVTLRLSDPGCGASLELIAPWPARQGMILTPEGKRLQHNTPLSVDALRGWRVILPEGEFGELQFRLARSRAVAQRVAGEVPLAAHAPLIKALLAQEGPDAQVNVRVITGGAQSPRIEIRRYERQAVVQNGRLRLDLPRDEPVGEETVFSQKLVRGTAILHTADMTKPETPVKREIDVEGSIDLEAVFSDSHGPWLIQAVFNEKVQRPVVWAKLSAPHSTRDERIAEYVREWERLVQAPEEPSWEFLWKLIRAASEGGDAGALDQVQALAKVPEAAIVLLLRVPQDELNDVFALELAAPVFWPAILVQAFTTAVKAVRAHLVGRYGRVLDPAEAEQEASATLARRVGAALTLHPELAGHFGAALADAQLGHLIHAHPETLAGVVIPHPETKLVELAHEAARRFDRLPSGIGRIEPLYRPRRLSFNHFVQPVVDAPLVTAEIAAGRRSDPDRAEIPSLVNLRLVDPLYFDAALPAALAFVLQQANA